MNWWKEDIVYQIYPKSFKDSNNDGIGDIKGIIEKLDYLEDLGINTIWICPFFQSPMIDNGYDISNYYQVDPMFGTNEDLYELIDQAKKKNIKILFDLVVNHCSDQHEWFQKAIAEPNSKERNYFIIKKKEEITNWRAIFGGNSWSPLPNSNDEEYYFHVFSKEQPDLNWENPELRKEIYKMINFWLDKGIKGFRVDAITYIKKNQQFPNFAPDGLDGLAHVDKGSINQPGIESFLKEMKTETFDKYDCMTVGEAVGVPYKDLEQYVGDGGCFSMIFEFSYDNPSMPSQGNWYDYKQWTVDEWKQKIYKAQKHISKIGWSPTHIENHDSPRSINKFLHPDQICGHSVKMLATIFFYLRSTPFIYQGQELGMSNVHFNSIDDYDDISTHDHFQRALNAGFKEEEALRLISPRSRDNARTPMQWSNSKYAGFSEVTPWLKVNSNYQNVNVDQQLNDPKSILNYYKKMIELRKQKKYCSVLVYGEFSPLFENMKNIVAYQRTNNEQTIYIINNFQSEYCEIEVEMPFKVLLNNYTDITVSSQRLIYLKPFQSLVLDIE
ncbi:glycoside hydrolase family 13 protein [Gracilibacillus timonensis]|uniref:glycoside hydrolase family 13 protein n=1 Tax=Gracilibacillus timonensis TaxID=1816696 RepID=UPI000823FCA4|nr:alpha-glucosidase [Gracilibacillus timonensis]